MTIRKKNIRILIITITIIGIWFVYDLVLAISNHGDGRFATSKSKEKSIENDFFIVDYTPSSDTLKLIDGRNVIIKKVWSEASWTYKNGKPVITDGFGYSLNLEFEGNNEDFVFTFKLLDKDNQAFTNGIGKGVCNLRPERLEPFIDIVLVEKNPDKNVGWKKGIVTDTIRMKSSEIKNMP